MSASEDLRWMHRALELAEHGRGHVEPNPLVGAVLVRDGRVVGEGWHERFGGPHAEVHALAQAGAAASGATLYVTLEPCCHHGKTPPCTDALLRAGVGRVVAATTDPFPPVAGQGEGLLRAAGVRYDTGIMEGEARRLNAPYLTLLTQGRPYVHAKWAMSLDGKIATRMGESRWISNEASRQRVHELRGRMDGILVGIGTALADDPRLTARPPGPRLAVRFVLDSTARLPPESQLAATASSVRTVVVAGSGAPVERVERLRARGCEILTPQMEDGRPSIAALLQELGRRRMTNLLVEGGAEVLGSFFDAGLIDEVHVFVGPRLIGGAQAKTPLGGRGRASIREALTVARLQVQTLGGDVYLYGPLGSV